LTDSDTTVITQRANEWIQLLSASFAANSTRQLYVFGHNGDAFGMDRAEIGVLEQA
jgi:hypothetical protein